MDYAEKKKKLAERLARAEERAQKSKNELKELKKRLKALDKPENSLTRKQENSIKIWHGIACLALIKECPEFAEKVKDYLEKNVKSPRQRQLMGLALLEEKKISTAPEKKYSKVFGKFGPVLAQERVDLIVPFPDPPEARQRAKAAGAKWDGKTWYVEEGFDLTLIEEFLPQNKDWTMYDLI